MKKILPDHLRLNKKEQKQMEKRVKDLLEKFKDGIIVGILLIGLFILFSIFK